MKIAGPLQSIRKALLTERLRVFSERSFATLVRDHPEWNRTPSALRTDLVDAGILKKATLRSEDYSSKQRYLMPEATAFELALSLQKGAFLCHASAASLHGLTEQVPQTFYVNVEQTAKPSPKGDLVQETIDRAFRNTQRVSRYVFTYNNQRFVQLSGKHTNRAGVIELPVEQQRTYPCTSLERTLIDLMVRPSYGGGVHEVLASFRLAKDRTSISSLLACLRSLDYRYPYHQALGFYLERAGFEDRHLARLRELPMTVNFYLTYGMRDPGYSATWKLYHPKTL